MVPQETKIPVVVVKQALNVPWETKRGFEFGPTFADRDGGQIHLYLHLFQKINIFFTISLARRFPLQGVADIRVLAIGQTGGWPGVTC
jgi:hypothetical protein